ncbi:uroporphyrinogen-III synthase [Marinilabilia salmonicolor]|uniref:uroporphyrinogen-III synthase n=1 Tax=Marinilabilia salmonicolor TaxID=989 RepID=UPI000299DA44|nr:uroporphyrinogen-III synthase [Marinilabilia salmonicolor]
MRKQPLVISTWPVRANDRFAEVLKAKGMLVLSCPMIEINFRIFSIPGRLSEYDWVVFTSKNGATSFLEQCSFHSNNQIAVIGEGTAAPLRSFGIEPDFVGAGHSGVEFAGELLDLLGKGKRVLLALGNLAPDTLSDVLTSQNTVERIDVYETRSPDSMDQAVMNQIKADDYDFIAVSSPSAIRNLYEQLEETARLLRIVSIGETTSDAVRELGIEPVATASEQSYEGLAQCVLELVK